MPSKKEEHGWTAADEVGERNLVAAGIWQREVRSTVAGFRRSRCLEVMLAGGYLTLEERTDFLADSTDDFVFDAGQHIVHFRHGLPFESLLTVGDLDDVRLPIVTYGPAWRKSLGV